MRSTEMIRFMAGIKPKPKRLAIAILALALATAPAASAAVFNCSGSPFPGDTTGTICLIAAIKSANLHTDSDTINLGPGHYAIVGQLYNTGEGPNGLPVITTHITIQGVGGRALLERPATALTNYRILQVAASGNLTLQSVEISGGALFGFPVGNPTGSGGGILNLGTLTLIDVSIRNNRVRGPASACQTVDPGGSGSDVKGLGGGIRNLGTLSVNTSAIVGNGSDLAGGGIANSGSAFITRSTINFNDSSEGAGIFTEGGAMTIDNTTMAFNHESGPAKGAGGGIFVNSGTLSVSNSTVADNSMPSSVDCPGKGGGIANEAGTVNLQNTILARNTAFVFEDGDPPPPPVEAGPDCSGPIASLGNNLIGDSSGCTISLLASDRSGDPGFRSFNFAGYFPLLPTSQAIDAGNPASCTASDQLGQPRFDGDRNGSVICDIGAVEFFPGETDVSEFVTLAPLVTTSDPSPVPGGPAGTFSIRATFTNTSAISLHDAFFKVRNLSGGNLLLNADGGPAGAGAILTPNVGADGALSPGESVTVDFIIGLQVRRHFDFVVDFLGELFP